MLVLTGKSATGKDCVAKELISKLGYEKLVTFTTRDNRKGERDGIDYHFITTEEFLQKLSNDFFLEFRFYETEMGILFYGSSKKSFRLADNKTIAILTPSGLKKLKENSIPCTSFYINVSDEEIKRRQIIRGDDISEAERRFNADKIDFEGVENVVDYVISNEGVSIEEVASEIDRLYRGNNGD